MSKVCAMCMIEKDASFFSVRSRSKDGLQGNCKSCSHEAKRIWIQANRAKEAKNKMWSRYRLRPEDFEALLKKQNNVCGLCREPFNGLPVVDHDHACCSGYKSCGQCVRGLLHASCNKLLGGYEAVLALGTVDKYLMR